MLLLLVIAGFFIRWAPYYGGTVLVLFASAAVMAAAIWVSQRRRYALAVQGISQEQYPPAIGSAAALSCGVVVLGLSAVAFLLLT